LEGKEAVIFLPVRREARAPYRSKKRRLKQNGKALQKRAGLLLTDLRKAGRRGKGEIGTPGKRRQQERGVPVADVTNQRKEAEQPLQKSVLNSPFWKGEKNWVRRGVLVLLIPIEDERKHSAGPLPLPKRVTGKRPHGGGRKR